MLIAYLPYTDSEVRVITTINHNMYQKHYLLNEINLICFKFTGRSSEVFVKNETAYAKGPNMYDTFYPAIKDSK